MEWIYIFLILCAIVAFGVIVYRNRHRISKLMAKLGGIIELAQDLRTYPSLSEDIQTRLASKQMQIRDFVAQSKIAASTTVPIGEYLHNVEEGEESISVNRISRWASGVLSYHPELIMEDRFLVILYINTWLHRLADFADDSDQKAALKLLLADLLVIPECTQISQSHSGTTEYTTDEMRKRVMKMLLDAPIILDSGEKIRIDALQKKVIKDGYAVKQSEMARWVYNVMSSAKLSNFEYAIVCSLVYYIDVWTYLLSDPDRNIRYSHLYESRYTFIQH
jgi:hypothetical protein